MYIDISCMGLFLFVSVVKSKTPIEITASIKLYLKNQNAIASVKDFSE